MLPKERVEKWAKERVEERTVSAASGMAPRDNFGMSPVSSNQRERVLYSTDSYYELVYNSPDTQSPEYLWTQPVLEFLSKTSEDMLNQDNLLILRTEGEMGVVSLTERWAQHSKGRIITPGDFVEPDDIRFLKSVCFSELYRSKKLGGRNYENLFDEMVRNTNLFQFDPEKTTMHVSGIPYIFTHEKLVDILKSLDLPLTEGDHYKLKFFRKTDRRLNRGYAIITFRHRDDVKKIVRSFKHVLKKSLFNQGNECKRVDVVYSNRQNEIIWPERSNTGPKHMLIGMGRTRFAFLVLTL